MEVREEAGREMFFLDENISPRIVCRINGLSQDNDNHVVRLKQPLGALKWIKTGRTCILDVAAFVRRLLDRPAAAAAATNLRLKQRRQQQMD